MKMKYDIREMGYVGKEIVVDQDSFSEAEEDYLKDHPGATEDEAYEYLLEESHWDVDMEGVRAK